MRQNYIPSTQNISSNLQTIIRNHNNIHNKQNESLKKMLLGNALIQRLRKHSNLLSTFSKQKNHQIKTMNNFHVNKQTPFINRLKKNNHKYTYSIINQEFDDQVERPQSSFPKDFYDKQLLMLQQKKKAEIRYHSNDNKLIINKYFSESGKFSKKCKKKQNRNHSRQLCTIQIQSNKNNITQNFTQKNILNIKKGPEVIHMSLNFTPLSTIENYNSKYKQKTTKSMLKIKTRMLKRRKIEDQENNVECRSALQDLQIQVNQMKIHQKQNIEKPEKQCINVKIKNLNRQGLKTKSKYKYPKKYLQGQISPWLNENTQQQFLSDF